jgi:hypothetical protein
MKDHPETVAHAFGADLNILTQVAILKVCWHLSSKSQLCEEAATSILAGQN